MLGNLGKNLTKTMKKLAGMSIVDEEVVREVIKRNSASFNTI